MTETAKVTHTPGPFIAVDDGYGEDVNPPEPGKRWLTIQTLDGEEIAVIVNRTSEPTDEQHADARLLAAAPDMLAAAVAVLAATPCSCLDAYKDRDLDDPTCAYHNIEPEFDALRAAIDKALPS